MSSCRRSKTRELAREYRAVVEEILEGFAATTADREHPAAIAEPGARRYLACLFPELSYVDRVRLLQTLDVVRAASLASRDQRGRLTDIQLAKVRPDVESDVNKQQRRCCASRWNRSAKGARRKT